MYDCTYIILESQKNVTFSCPLWRANSIFKAWLFCHDDYFHDLDNDDDGQRDDDDGDDDDGDDNDDDDGDDDDDDDYDNLVDGQWVLLCQPWAWSSLGSCFKKFKKKLSQFRRCAGYYLKGSSQESLGSVNSFQGQILEPPSQCDQFLFNFSLSYFLIWKCKDKSELLKKTK